MTAGPLDKHLEWLYGDVNRCKCKHALVSGGVVCGTSMGKMWGRVTTHPDCPEHGTFAERERTNRLRAKDGRPPLKDVSR